MDCGPTCLRMICRYYGKYYSQESIKQKAFITREGVSLLDLAEAAESIGFKTIGASISLQQLKEDATLPCILHWNQNHFVICYKIKNNQFYIADPSIGLIKYSEDEFKRHFLSVKEKDENHGIILILKPTPDFYSSEDDRKENRTRLSFFFRYLTPYKKQFVQLALAMLTGSLLQLILPFLTQTLVDTGIRDADLNFITLILICQLLISVGQLSVDFIRSWILLHMNTRINIALISDFLAKLMRMPLSYFDTKMIGDIMQRVGDHGRIESFLTGSSINVLFSFVNFIIFGAILGYYNMYILVIFILGNILYVSWILFFMKYRRQLDYKRFTQASNEQSNLFQLITGMQEIKLNNCEMEKRWQWERIQVRLFKINIKGLALGQYQQVGSIFFNQSTNIFISYLAARAVIDGNMTLGMMTALTYIVGQLSSPVEQFIGFAQAFQDAKISLERLGEIHLKEDEENQIVTKINEIPLEKTISIENLSFSYSGAERDYVLKDISLTIPENKVTAIVGTSGSGKTTLIKLLLGFYIPNNGIIKIGKTPLQNINHHLWRAKTGSVMQDGFIFSDTIARNIAIGVDSIDKNRLMHAVTVANIRDFIESLPLGYNTKIGIEGNGVSQGQCQRILIARAVYKNPEFIFLDEATNSLDASNEKEIMEHLHSFYKGRTVVVVAHRLSTVCDADNIIVLHKGELVEEGTHEFLINKKGVYYNLVRSQLELGS
ncbi:MAG: peptidase domain-containing ABC transporter [Tannerellaceae bacterium]|nr:peptidase domain-containing ABC transporter [Tannerellaceae bacterium]